VLKYSLFEKVGFCDLTFAWKSGLPLAPGTN
jgi:hypothetical protein